MHAVRGAAFRRCNGTSAVSLRGGDEGQDRSDGVRGGDKAMTQIYHVLVRCRQARRNDGAGLAVIGACTATDW